MNPVDVLIKSAFDLATTLQANSLCFKDNWHVSTITFKIFEPHSFLIALISWTHFSKSKDFKFATLITISISSAPNEIAFLVS